MKKPARKFTLTTAIQRRRALRFAARFYPLNFGRRMALVAAERTVAQSFALAACFVLMLAAGCQPRPELSPAELVEKLDTAFPGQLNGIVCDRMDGRELLGAALANLSLEGADEEEIANAIADARECRQR